MRLEATCRALAEAGTLQAAIRVPDAAGDLLVQADLRTRKVITSVALDAPATDGRPTTRVGWVVRQLKEAPEGLVIEAASSTRRRRRPEFSAPSVRTPRASYSKPIRSGRRESFGSLSPLHGEIYNVFAIADGTINRIEDFADRDAALAAAGLAAG